MVSWGAVCFHKVISVCGIPFSLILVFGFWFFFFGMRGESWRGDVYIYIYRLYFVLFWVWQSDHFRQTLAHVVCELWFCTPPQFFFFFLICFPASVDFFFFFLNDENFVI